jgi:hypothetical protein
MGTDTIRSQSKFGYQIKFSNQNHRLEIRSERITVIMLTRGLNNNLNAVTLRVYKQNIIPLGSGTRWMIAHALSTLL